MPIRRNPLQCAVAVAAVLFASAALVSCHSSSQTSGPGSADYPAIVSAFYSGVAALDAGDVEHAPVKLALAVKLAPNEPAAWANLALNQMRSSNLDEAAQSLQKARSLAPDNGEIIALAADLAVDKGDFAGAIDLFDKAIAKDPSDLKTRWALYQAIQQQSGPDADKQSEEQLRDMLGIAPSNIVLILELTRIAAKNGNSVEIGQLLTQAAKESTSWPADARRQLTSAVASASNTRADMPQIMMLQNLVKSTPEYQADIAELQVPEGTIADPIPHFIDLPNPPDTPAAPDTGLAFTSQDLGGPKGSAVKSILPGFGITPVTLFATAKTVMVKSPRTTQILPFPGGSTPPNDSSVLPVDLDDTGKLDYVMAGAGGLKIYKPSGDAASSAKLPPAITGGSFTGAWTAELYTGGAVDLVLGAKSGAPTALRNNDNGTFTPIHPFPGVTGGLRAFTWADLDGDGVGDAAFIDNEGRLHVFQNLRAGNFKEWPAPAGIDKAVAVTAADIDRSGRFALVVWCANGAIESISLDAANHWSVKPLVAASPPTDWSGRLIFADLDNNGALDLIATSSAGTQIWLGDGSGGLVPLVSKVDARQVSIADDGVSGRLNLIGLSSTGAPTLFKNQGTKNYNWQQITLQATSKGDGKNNSFGIGGQIDIRAGLLYEDQRITGPVTHFGLGTYPSADFARILWPNGLPQAEFELKPDQLVQTSERLKGSCPWLFAWNGSRMAFVKDFLWRSALGLRIDAQDTSGGGMTGDWNKIDGDQLVPRDGYYDLRLTTQLWESYFFDRIKLMVVDHPAGTDMWVDERFCVPPPALAYHITTHAKPVARAVDDLGNDVTDVLRARDGRYLDTFGLGRYQGVTRDHWVQLDLGPAPGGPARQWLLAEGWIHPTDSSINMQLSLGEHPRPTGLSLEVPDGRGGWRVARTGIGFPEGKNKTILIDLTGLFRPGQPRQVRLRTNLEIYWDWMGTATEIGGSLAGAQGSEGVAGAKAVTRVLDPSVADLRYHGFNHIDQAVSPFPEERGGEPSHSAPEIPDYDRLAAVGQQWRDMEGFYTRYGDVRELLKSVDDRYVIMNAGDEIALRFPAAPPPSPGYVRDYILTGDGWGKDCDINSGFSKTILPLPSHADLKYNRPAGPLVDDPVYKAHKQDWLTYQTRYVSPRPFETSLVR